MVVGNQEESHKSCGSPKKDSFKCQLFGLHVEGGRKIQGKAPASLQEPQQDESRNMTRMKAVAPASVKALGVASLPE